MKYRIGTLEEYLIEYPNQVGEEESSQVRKYKNPRVDNEYLWESEGGNIEDAFNIISTWSKSIKVDATRCAKYVIYNNDGEYICTKVDPDSCINFGFKVTDIEIFDTEKDYLSRAKELGIEIEDF